MNPNAYYVCNAASKNCPSGCCTGQGTCATKRSQCTYQYNNWRQYCCYYFPGDINPNYNTNCLYYQRDCVSGCCTSSGKCSLAPSTCSSKFLDFNTNQNYYFPSIAHVSCNSLSRHCSSGCCDQNGYCANNSYYCVNKYSDFQTNKNYYFSQPEPNLQPPNIQFLNIVLLIMVSVGFALLLMIIAGIIISCWKYLKNKEKNAFSEIVEKFKQENNLQLPQQAQNIYQGIKVS